MVHAIRAADGPTGGDFAVGSSYFYLEFLLALHHLLLDRGYQNPAVFALDYTLVPDVTYPTQLAEALLAYKCVLKEVAGNGSRICIAGDSAGGTLVLSLLLQLAIRVQRPAQNENVLNTHCAVPTLKPPLALAVPRMATLIGPWVKIKSHLHYPSKVEYLDRRTLWKYAHAYAGEAMLNQFPASPGSCLDEKLWEAVSPERGYLVIYGEQEVFAPDIQDFVNRQIRQGVEMRALRVEGGIHAWPIVSFFASSTAERRLQGLKLIADQISRLIDIKKEENGEEKTEALGLDQVDRHTTAQ